MEHVVFYPASDGTPAFQRLTDLDEAVRLVEHLRNIEGVSSVSVHALTEVPLAFRAYYRVELPVAALSAAAMSAEPPAVPAVEPAAALVGLVPEQGEEQDDVPDRDAVNRDAVDRGAVDREAVAVPALAAGSNPGGPAGLGFFA